MKKSLHKVQRFELGHEACERLLPLPMVIANEKKRVGRGGLSLVTPIVSQDGLKRIQDWALLLDDNDEIVANDLGVLVMVDRDFRARPLIGRILGRNIILSLVGMIHDPVLAEEFLALLGKRIAGIECDADSSPDVMFFLQSKMEIRPCHRSGKIFGVTRRCIFKAKVADKFGACRKECQHMKILAANAVLGKLFVLQENALILHSSPSNGIKRMKDT